MKKILLVLTIIMPMVVWSQDSIQSKPLPLLEPSLTLSTSARANNPKPKLLTRDNISFSDFDISLSGVRKVENLTATDLYNATLVWLQSFYRHPNDVIRVNTPEKIVIEGRLGIHLSGDDDINGIVTFEFKEGRYKWSINDCINIDPFMRSLGYRDKRIIELPRYQRAAATETLISDFTPFVTSFINKISSYQPGITPIPENLSSDW